MLEEAHELVAAIDSADAKAIVDELGDVLLQVILHSQIGSEHDDFGIQDVIEAISSKLIRRHPHVFGDASNDLPSVHRRWREIKQSEGRTSRAQPTLVRAKRLLGALEVRGTADGILEAARDSNGEEKAGLEILCALLKVVRDGHDPEIALLKGIEHLERET